MFFNIVLILRLQATCYHFCVEIYAFKFQIIFNLFFALKSLFSLA